MKILSVNDPAFDVFGKVINGYDLGPVLSALSKLPKPEGVTYVPSDPTLESTCLFPELSNGLYGGMHIQFGYCNGFNKSLNCLEFHRGSETLITEDSIILLVAPLSKMKNNTIDTSEVEAFLMPAGSAVLLYETTMHYAPCNEGNCGFRTVVVLPRGTNEAKPDITIRSSYDSILWGRNKWLIAHPETSEASAGAFIGIKGNNIVLD